MKKQTCFSVFIILSLLSQCFCDPSPYVTPTDWTDGAHTSGCKAMDGTSSIVPDPNTIVSFNT
jgi:hypothetical protein